MSLRLRLFLMVLMFIALLFGFLQLFIPGTTLYNFERLHIFLFNLCSGGTILIYFSEGRTKLSKKALSFLILSLAYALLAFMNCYLPAMLVAFAMAIIVDSVRIRKFSLFPFNFFQSGAPVAAKFHQASLLCLSMGLTISGLVILNNQYLKLVSLQKLTLDTFFLGFSFPISLITMSIIFSFMRQKVSRLVLRLKNMGFWNVNLGVIIFFLFILFEKLIPQLVVTTILFFSVVLIYFMYKDLSDRVQQKSFLTSGMFFLWYTAITGIIYIALEFRPDYNHEHLKYLLRMHSFASLYGWNLSGLAVICRKDDFPIRLHSQTVIAVHWLTAIVLAPLGTYFRSFAIPALIAYGYILYMILFSAGVQKPEGA
ncbi:MAG: hypothetical protein LJE94_03745 [Deltaproteobacteria bacterium]|nr:hypothetical protein [Deltaproteobacteria bacterium]